MTTHAAPAPAPLPALEVLYATYGFAVHGRCRYLLGSEDAAWDATQEVFLKAERGRQSFEGRASHHTWLMRIATHHCLNQIRARKVRIGRGQVDVADLDRHTAQPATSEVALTVRGLLDLFDPQTQALAVHYYVDEMSQEEVAVAVGLSVPTVRKRLEQFVERARRALIPDAAPARRKL